MGVQPLGDGGKPFEIREEDGEKLRLPPKVQAVRVAKNLFEKLIGEVIPEDPLNKLFLLSHGVVPGVDHLQGGEKEACEGWKEGKGEAEEVKEKEEEC